LRHIESYRGILIITTNRVADFDKGVMSRIDLAIRFSEFNPETRKELWKKMFKCLEFEHDVDQQWLDEQLDELAACDMNGRQVRNAFEASLRLTGAEKTDAGWEVTEPSPLVDALHKACATSNTFRRHMVVDDGDESDKSESLA
jgi:AAA+ superfamily predicted ATPase